MSNLFVSIQAVYGGVELSFTGRKGDVSVPSHWLNTPASHFKMTAGLLDMRSDAELEILSLPDTDRKFNGTAWVKCSDAERDINIDAVVDADKVSDDNDILLDALNDIREHVGMSKLKHNDLKAMKKKAKKENKKKQKKKKKENK